MRRPAVFFLVVMALGMAIVLAWLGWLTAESNLLGWFLLMVGFMYFFGVIFIFWIRRVQFWQAQGTGAAVGEEASDRSFWLIVAGMVAVFYVPPLEYLLLPAFLPHTDLMEVIGLLIIFSGSFLFISARRALGKHYSGHVSVYEGQQLVQHGPYRFVRHPAYAGYILIALGLAVGYSSLVGLVAIPLVLLPAVLYRLGVEDRLLAEHFGVQFEEYAARVERLIPGIW
jgi:protein-S-isoprenylcysteine O-methyltransferase Ste14